MFLSILLFSSISLILILKSFKFYSQFPSSETYKFSIFFSWPAIGFKSKLCICRMNPMDSVLALLAGTAQGWSSNPSFRAVSRTKCATCIPIYLKYLPNYNSPLLGPKVEARRSNSPNWAHFHPRLEQVSQLFWWRNFLQDNINRTIFCQSIIYHL